MIVDCALTIIATVPRKWSLFLLRPSSTASHILQPAGIHECAHLLPGFIPRTARLDIRYVCLVGWVRVYQLFWNHKAVAHSTLLRTHPPCRRLRFGEGRAKCLGGRRVETISLDLCLSDVVYNHIFIMQCARARIYAYPFWYGHTLGKCLHFTYMLPAYLCVYFGTHLCGEHACVYAPGSYRTHSAAQRKVFGNDDVLPFECVQKKIRHMCTGESTRYYVTSF